MRYLIYVRVSTNSQGEYGLGAQAQLEACHQYIKEQSLKGQVIAYTDVVSGKLDKKKELLSRPQLAIMLSQIQKGDIVVSAKRDRMARNSFLIMFIERDLNKLGAKFVTADGMSDGEEPTDILMRSILDAFAEYEGLIISQRTSLALQVKIAKGERVGHIPYGFMLDEKRNLLINPEEAQILKDIHNCRTNGNMTYRDIAIYLNDLGIKNRPNAKRPVVLWTHGATCRVYKNYSKII